MLRGSRDSDITLASRFECKYVVSPELAFQIRDFIQPFVRPDRYAAGHAGFRYPICSLYLDTDDLKLYQQTVGGDKDRFKLRIRSYDDDPASRVFLEVKRKVNSIVRKRRARVAREHARTLLRTGLDGWTDELAPETVIDAEFFSKLTRLSSAKPVLRIKYLREAYESKWGEPVRITLDTDLMHAITLHDCLAHGPGRWTATPMDGVILEIKFTDVFPSWVQDTVRIFGLKQQPVPKYIMSMDHVLMAGRASALALAGFSMPPQRA